MHAIVKSVFAAATVAAAVSAQAGNLRRGVVGKKTLESSCDGVDQAMAWDGKKFLNEAKSYELKWKLSADMKSITMLASIQDLVGPTWIGIGISEVGHMLGSDLIQVVNTIDDDGEPNIFIRDSHVEWYAMDPARLTPKMMHPTTDTYQSSELICTTRTDDKLMFIFTRPLDTTDLQDRAIVAGNVPVIWAYGTGHDVHYHYQNRGSTGVTFFGGGSMDDPPDTNGHVDLVFSAGFTTSVKEKTQYACQSFDMGEEVRHVVAANAVLSGEAVKMAHHIIVHACGHHPGDIFNLHRDGPSVCLDKNHDPDAYGNSPLGSMECTTLVYGWNRGGTKMILPLEAGIPIGGGFNRYLILEFHIDNPDKLARSVEQLGVRLSTTTAMRPYNAASMAIGDSATSFANSALQPQEVPAGEENTHYEASCSATCTERWLGEIHVFSAMLHMHMTGRTIFLTKTTPDGDTAVVDYRQFWNMGYQSLAPAHFSVTPGDRMNLHCSYDTRWYSEPIPFGHAATDEMCNGFLFYYPAASAVPFCGFLEDKSTCGGLYSVIDEVNPQSDGMTELPFEYSFGNVRVPTGVPTRLEVPSEPTEIPSEAPSETPSEAPSEAPSVIPSAAPSVTPSAAPSAASTRVPVALRTANPTRKPIVPPASSRPSLTPTRTPSNPPRPKKELVFVVV